MEEDHRGGEYTLLLAPSRLHGLGVMFGEEIFRMKLPFHEGFVCLMGTLDILGQFLNLKPRLAGWFRMGSG